MTFGKCTPVMMIRVKFFVNNMVWLYFVRSNFPKSHEQSAFTNCRINFAWKSTYFCACVSCILLHTRHVPSSLSDRPYSSSVNLFANLKTRSYHVGTNLFHISVTLQEEHAALEIEGKKNLQSFFIIIFRFYNYMSTLRVL